MLDALDQIKWSAYHTSHGPATDVPHWLRATLSGSKQESETAWMKLSSVLCHQGMVLDSAVVVTPFLIELLHIPHVYQKEQAVDLLACFATGSAWANNVALELRHSVGPQWDTWTSEQRNRWLKQLLHQTLVPHIPLLYPYATYPCAIREEVITALAHFPEHASTSMTILDKATAIEPDNQIRRLMQACATHLSGGRLKPEYRKYLFLDDQ